MSLADTAGQTTTLDLATVCARGIVETDQNPPHQPALAAGLLPNVDPRTLQQARWWEDHILEILTGHHPDCDGGPQPDFDPDHHPLHQREEAKAAQLRAQGIAVTARTLRRKRQRYQARGLAGLLDGRSSRSSPARIDPRVVEATGQVIAETTDASTRTISFWRWRVEQLLATEYGPETVPMPSRAGFYRLFGTLAHGRHATGSARTRRSRAAQPPTPFGVFTPTRPGQVMQIDSTPLDVLVLLADGVTGRVELTGMIDVATRTVTAAVLRPTTKAVDASLLLARTVTPEPMRPGWAQVLAMSRSVLPHQHLLTIDQRLEHAAARPVIIPELIVCDQGKVFVSHTFRASCRLLGIDLQPTLDGCPAQKPHIERTLGSVATLFTQYLSGYLGSSVEHRGRDPAARPLWSLMQLQELLDEWIVACWQNRPHEGLRDPVTPGQTFTPNERYASLITAAGYVPLALSANDYVELLPATWRTIRPGGIRIAHRTYDDQGLDPWRGQPSGVTNHHNQWEIHYDPYDVTRIFVRDHHGDQGWITAVWKYLSSAPMPFGELAWDHALTQLRAAGANPTEPQIAAAVGALLTRANQGPPAISSPAPRTTGGQSDRRIAARTHAARPVLDENIVPTSSSLPEVDPTDLTADDQPIVPLEIFDARKEAQRWW